MISVIINDTFLGPLPEDESLNKFGTIIAQKIITSGSIKEEQDYLSCSPKKHYVVV